MQFYESPGNCVRKQGLIQCSSTPTSVRRSEHEYGLRILGVLFICASDPALPVAYVNARKRRDPRRPLFWLFACDVDRYDLS